MPQKLNAFNKHATSLVLEELEAGHTAKLHVASGSMRPLILPGDTLHIEPVPGGKTRIGEIVVFMGPHGLTAHRLIKRANHGNQAVTAGDACTEIDIPFPTSAILGKVTAIQRGSSVIPTKTGLPARISAFKLSVKILLRRLRKKTLSASAAKLAQANGDQALLAMTGYNPEKPEFFPLTGHADWDLFMQKAEAEGLTGLIYKSCKKPRNLPDHVIEKMRSSYYTTFARNTIMLEKTDAFINMLSAFEVIELKGIWLIRHVYQDPGLRRFGDIDLLIRLEDIRKIDKILLKNGFSRPQTVFPEKLSASLNSIPYKSPGHDAVFHVHWGLFNSIMPRYAGCDINMEDVWSSAARVETGTQMRVEHHIIHLAAHALKHSFERLVFLKDIAETTTRFQSEIDWDLVANQSMKWNISAHVYYSLLFASEKAGAQIPDEILQITKPKHAGPGSRLFTNAVRKGKRKAESCNLVFIENAGPFPAQVKTVWRILFPSRQDLAATYGIAQETIGIRFYIKRIARGAACFLNRKFLRVFQEAAAFSAYSRKSRR